MLEATRLALDSAPALVERRRPLRVARDQRVQPVSFDPCGLRRAFAGLALLIAPRRLSGSQGSCCGWSGSRSSPASLTSPASVKTVRSERRCVPPTSTWFSTPQWSSDEFSATDMERRLSSGRRRVHAFGRSGSGWVWIGWAGGGPAGCARRAVRLICAGWDRRTMVRRGEPLSKVERGLPRLRGAGCS
jgi:hypothetical protein